MHDTGSYRLITRIRPPRLPPIRRGRPAEGDELIGFEEEKSLITQAFTEICTAGGLRLTEPLNVFAERRWSPVQSRKTRRWYPEYQKALFMTTHASATVRYDPGNMPVRALNWAFNESKNKIGGWNYSHFERELDFLNYWIQNEAAPVVQISLLYQTEEEPDAIHTLMRNARVFAESGQYEGILAKMIPAVAKSAENDFYAKVVGGADPEPLRPQLAADGGSFDNVLNRLRSVLGKLDKI